MWLSEWDRVHPVSTKGDIRANRCISSAHINRPLYSFELLNDTLTYEFKCLCLVLEMFHNLTVPNRGFAVTLGRGAVYVDPFSKSLIVKGGFDRPVNYHSGI